MAGMKAQPKAGDPSFLLDARLECPTVKLNFERKLSNCFSGSGSTSHSTFHGIGAKKRTKSVAIFRENNPIVNGIHASSLEQEMLSEPTAQSNEVTETPESDACAPGLVVLRRQAIANFPTSRTRHGKLANCQ